MWFSPVSTGLSSSTDDQPRVNEWDRYFLEGTVLKRRRVTEPLGKRSDNFVDYSSLMISYLSTQYMSSWCWIVGCTLLVAHLSLFRYPRMNQQRFINPELTQQVDHLSGTVGRLSWDGIRWDTCGKKMKKVIWAAPESVFLSGKLEPRVSFCKPDRAETSNPVKFSMQWVPKNNGFRWLCLCPNNHPRLDRFSFEDYPITCIYI